MKAAPELVQGWPSFIRGANAVVLADENDVGKGSEFSEKIHFYP